MDIGAFENSVMTSMIKKHLIIQLIILIGLLTPAVGLAQEATPTPQLSEGYVHIVRGNESLSGLANRYYDNIYAWPVIWQATNAKAKYDPRFELLVNPEHLEAGQFLWIPPAEDIPLWLAGYVPEEAQLQPLTVELLQTLANYTEEARQRFDIPGAALVIVQGSEIRLAQGFGVRELGRPEPVTPETIFAVGSTTKALNAMLMATLVDDGLITWEEPVTDVWSEFQVGDSPFTKTIRVRHLLNMSSGLPRADLVWSGTDLTAEELMTSLAELEPWANPGDYFLYNNQTVATAGYLGAMAAGGEYGQLSDRYVTLMQQRIFDPISMTTATFSFTTVLAQPNHATPHDLNLTGEVSPTHHHVDRSIHPAGGVYASATDMARFLMTEINRGVAPNGRRVVSTANLTETWQPQIEVIADRLDYGMGWFIEEYRGVTIIWHEGDVLGFKALLAFYPQSDVGLVLLSNRLLGKWFSYSVLYRFTELLYGLNDLYADAVYQKQQTTFEEALVKDYTGLQPYVTPEQVAAYVGEYEDQWRVELRADNTLWAVRGAYQWRLLEATDGDYYKIYNGFGLGSNLQFVVEADGSVTMQFWLSSGEAGVYKKVSDS